MTNLFSISLSPGKSPQLVGVGGREGKRGRAWRGRVGRGRERLDKVTVMFTLLTLIVT